MPATVKKLEQSIITKYHVETGDYFGLTGCAEVIEVLDDLLAVLFPGCYGREKISIDEITYFLHDSLRHISTRLMKHLNSVFQYQCHHEQKQRCECDERARLVIINLIESLPEIRGILLDDISTALAGDPAAYSLDEIVLSYPFIDAIATHRLAHNLYLQGVPIIPRIMSERAHSATGIDIHPGAVIGPGFFIDHGTGVVIGETCTIGKNVKLYQGVTLGALSPFDKEGNLTKGQKRHPSIEDDVIIYANATILGGNTVIGKGSIINGNSWVTRSVAAGTIVKRDQVVKTPK
ncbi:MAG: serine acetyltransferase [Spirochaetales bacterium]|nr:serine acetyltransferase [Spirochaetales bacterium]